MHSHITDADIERLIAGESADSNRARVLAHIGACQTCRAQWSGAVRVDESLRHQQIPAPEDLAARALASVLTAARPSRRLALTPIAQVAAALFAFAIGVGAGTLLGKARITDSVSAEAQAFLFVFSGSQAGTIPAAERMSIGRAFKAWSDSLARNGQLVVQGQLATGLPRLVAANEPNIDSAAVRTFASMEGFFVVRARDEAGALALARTCPYLRYGGSIVIRRQWISRAANGSRAKVAVGGMTLPR